MPSWPLPSTCEPDTGQVLPPPLPPLTTSVPHVREPPLVYCRLLVGLQNPSEPPAAALLASYAGSIAPTLPTPFAPVMPLMPTPPALPEPPRPPKIWLLRMVRSPSEPVT